jgi:hypothetical protein
MLNWAAEAEVVEVSKFSGFDLFIIAFTILIAIGVYRSLRAPKKNLFAIGFGGISLLTFLIMDVVMVMNWLGLMGAA